MPNRSSRDRKDLNELAASIIAKATDSESVPQEGKNPAAVALGRLGGRKGGLARAKKLSAKKRSEIARLAAIVRWSSKDEE